MKEVTLKFREVAVDGLPTESMPVYAYYGYGMQVVDYSVVHEAFCCNDNSDEKQVATVKEVFHDVSFWCPYELAKQLEEETTNAD